jgi:hypothetical protein
MSRGLTIVRAAERIPAAGQTEGIIREEALSTGMLWAGIARTARESAQAGTTTAPGKRSPT